MYISSIYYQAETVKVKDSGKEQFWGSLCVGFRIIRIMDPGSPESSDFMVDIVPQFAAVSPESECQDIFTKDQVYI